MTTQSRPWRMPWPFSKTTPTISPPSVSRSDFGELLQTPDYFQARCFFFLGQFEKSLLVWTQANRIRTNNKEVTICIPMHIDWTYSKMCQYDRVWKAGILGERGNGSIGGHNRHLSQVCIQSYF